MFIHPPPPARLAKLANLNSRLEWPLWAIHRSGREHNRHRLSRRLGRPGSLLEDSRAAKVPVRGRRAASSTTTTTAAAAKGRSHPAPPLPVRVPTHRPSSPSCLFLPASADDLSAEKVVNHAPRLVAVVAGRLSSPASSVSPNHPLNVPSIAIPSMRRGGREGEDEGGWGLRDGSFARCRWSLLVPAVASVGLLSRALSHCFVYCRYVKASLPNAPPAGGAQSTTSAYPDHETMVARMTKINEVRSSTCQIDCLRRGAK